MAYASLRNGRVDKIAHSEISKNSKNITLDIVIIYQTDQEVAVLDLQKSREHHACITKLNANQKIE